MQLSLRLRRNETVKRPEGRGVKREEDGRGQSPCVRRPLEDGTRTRTHTSEAEETRIERENERRSKGPEKKTNNTAKQVT